MAKKESRRIAVKPKSADKCVGWPNKWDFKSFENILILFTYLCLVISFELFFYETCSLTSHERS